PGDSILFARGSRFSGGILITDSGNEVNPIVLASYGEGPAPRFTNPQLGVLNGNMIQIRGSYTVVDGLYFHNGVGTTQEQEVNAREIAAVYLTLGADHNTIKNCEMVDCPLGVQSYGQYNLITHNYIHDCNRFLSEPNWGPIGIMVATSNHEISYNRIINYVRTGGTFGADGGAIEIDNEDYPNNNINIHHNWSVGNEGFLEIIWGSDITRDVRVAYNVSDDYQEFIFFWSGKDCFVENNTVLCTRPQNSRVKVVFSFNEGQNVIRNNIFVVANGLQVFTGTDVYGAERYEEQVFHHNLYWCADGSVEDPCGLPLGEGDIVADPRFVDLAKLDLHLLESSPAIDTGLDLDYDTDFDNRAVPFGIAPDMGAYEFRPSF
ncbi:choice-of-anchor Q domain-containing protein, partial [Candidatus Neomarinimicrobiota bacterium]